MDNLETLVENYLEYCSTQKCLDEKTLKAYRIDLRQFSEQTFPHEVTEITSKTLEDYIAKLHQQYTIFLTFIIFFNPISELFFFPHPQNPVYMPSICFLHKLIKSLTRFSSFLSQHFFISFSVSESISSVRYLIQTKNILYKLCTYRTTPPSIF